MSWFHEHPIMTFVLALFSILTVNNAVVTLGSRGKKKEDEEKQVL